MKLEIFDDYAAFTVARWSSKSSTGLNEADHTVMSLGFAGESGEMLDALALWHQHNGQLEQSALVKEFGDTWYYWARICAAFEIQPSALLSAHGVVVPPPTYTGSDTVLVRLICQAGGAVGRVTELMKKRTRDNVLSRDALESALAKAANELLELSSALGLETEEILALNRSKIEDRMNRGVLHGSGDNR